MDTEVYDRHAITIDVKKIDFIIQSMNDNISLIEDSFDLSEDEQVILWS